VTKVSDIIYDHLTANMEIKRKDILISNFLGGLAWGFGTVVGATVVVAILIYILRAVGVFNFLEPLLKPTV
jgi:hypothetical protein